MTFSSFRAGFAPVFVFGVLGAIGACDGDPGEQGPGGSDGADAIVMTTAEPPGANCAAGGTKVEAGVDANGDGALDPSESWPSPCSP